MARLTLNQRTLFDALHKSRQEDWKTFSKRDYKGIWASVIDKYPESAHFVYELLQNADDAEATEVYITLKRDRLLFKHNGRKHFDVTDVNDESVTVPGDINSITGIGDSSKEDSQNKIGKFGVGFKAVFQYTDVPEIYDDTFKFRIDNFIIPSLLEYDYPGREEGETLFVFPFKDENKSYQEILRRLEQLENPILFLRNIQKVTYRIDRKKNIPGDEILYSKSVIEKIEYDDNVVLERYELLSAYKKESIFLFSEPVNITDENDTEKSHLISVGFYYDDDKKKLITDRKHCIHCFFPTKETFESCFISHAPFLLTDNRQNLKPEESLNHDLLRFLSQLAISAILKLRDYGIEHKNLLITENITELTSANSYYYDPDDPEYYMGKAFREMIDTEKILLSRNGEYLDKSNAYTSTPRTLGELLTKEQFQALRKDDEVDIMKWELSQKIIELYRHSWSNDYTSSKFAKDITEDFMAAQDVKWVTRLYTFLRADASKLWKVLDNNKNANLPFRFAPIIKTENGDWVAPYADKDILNVFFPLEGSMSSDYNIISSEYLKIDLAMKFFRELEVKQPDEYDYIKSVILGRYRGEDVDGEDSVLQDEFITLLNYYDKVRKDQKAFGRYINLLKENLWLKGEDGTFYTPSSLYIDIPELKMYFSKLDADFINMLFYKKAANHYGVTNLNDFFTAIGAKSCPSMERVYIYSTSQMHEKQKKQIEGIRYNLSTYDFNDIVLKGFKEICDAGVSQEQSTYIWNTLLPQLNLHDLKTVEFKYKEKYARSFKSTPVLSSFFIALSSRKWIFNKEGKRCSADSIFKEELADEYNLTNGVLAYLNIQKKEKSIVELGGSQEQQDEMEMGQMLKRLGINSKEELMDYIASLEQEVLKKKAAERKAKKKDEPVPAEEDDTNNNTTSSESPAKDQKTIEEKLNEKWDNMANSQIGKPKNSGKNSKLSAEEIFSGNEGSVASQSKEPFFDKTARDDYAASRKKDELLNEKNLKKKNTEAQEKAEIASDQLEIMELLQQTEKFTYKWFKLLMELMHAEKSKATRVEVQIDFKDNEIICSEKLLHLSNPSKVIPSWIMDSDSIQIAVLTDMPIKLTGSIVKADEYSIDVALDIDNKVKRSCAKARLIRVIAENTSNFLDSLDRRFHQLGFDDDYNLNDNLTKEISFIYGPPGTGKTTTLVGKVHDLLQSKKKLNILVLTPTNKAADVIAEKMVDDDECYNWLTRFGNTESLYLIEDAGVVQTREDTDLSILDKNVIVTTAARYAYDYIQPDDTFICDIDWDYIIIDEASMIDILTVTYILYKGAGSKIIISGDPKQINPVVENGVPDYNIYDMVGLDSFRDAMNNYDRYPIEALTTQYRSIPNIGALVSNFTYDGMVKAYMERVSQKPLQIDGIKVDDINFIGYDIRDFSDIYGITAIKNSAFHLYAAIFTYNMVDYMVHQICKNHPGKDYSIGIVCPYGAEAAAISQMMDNRPIGNEYCTVTCGTVHSFQGDECDIMFVVLNPPAICGHDSHINKQNILNVAMSRARDYLFFILPNSQPNGFFMKNVIGKKADQVGCKNILHCKDIEKTIFGQEEYIASNTIVSCHKPVNVYCDVTTKYDVRMSDDAIDIKINE